MLLYDRNDSKINHLHFVVCGKPLCRFHLTHSIVFYQSLFINLIQPKGLYEINYYIDYINNNNKKFIKFIPLKLAYAISIHKSQGSTIDKLKIDIGNNIFANGQAYTALSRAKSLKDIQIININYNSFKTDLNIIKWYNSQKNI